MKYFYYFTFAIVLVIVGVLTVTTPMSAEARSIDNPPEEKERGDDGGTIGEFVRGKQAVEAEKDTPNGDEIMRILKKKLPEISGGGDDGDDDISERMNKAELIDAIASDAKISKADAKKALEGFTNVTTEILEKGDRISLIGFGSFSISKRSARTGRNPQIGHGGRDSETEATRGKIDEFKGGPGIKGIDDDGSSNSGENVAPAKGYNASRSNKPTSKSPVDADGDDGDDNDIQERMNKAELIDEIASKAGLSKADAKKALEGFTNATTRALKKGDRISLIGFGSFSISKRSARTGRNPQTGKEIQIAAKNVVKFKAGAELSKSVN